MTRQELQEIVAKATSSNTTGHEVLRKSVLDQTTVELVRDRSITDVNSTLFDAAFELGRAWEQKCTENEVRDAVRRTEENG